MTYGPDLASALCNQLWDGNPCLSWIFYDVSTKVLDSWDRDFPTRKVYGTCYLILESIRQKAALPVGAVAQAALDLWHRCASHTMVV